MSMERQMEEVFRAFKDLTFELNPLMRKKLADRHSQLFVQAARNRAPVSDEVHVHYNRHGERVEIHPGNLQRSIQVLRLRRAPYSTFVGPRVVKSFDGVYSGRRVNAYYAHWVEFGHAGVPAKPYMRPAFMENQDAFIAGMVVAYRHTISRWVMQQSHLRQAA